MNEGARITHDRVESKYMLPARAVRSFLRAATRELPMHRFQGEGANMLPDAQHFITSVYFDTPSGAHYRAATRDVSHNVKVRAREYYDLQPSLAELATDARQIVRFQPWVWFEVKQRHEARSQKLRFRLAKDEVAAFFRKQHPAFSGATTSELAGIVTYLRTLDEPLEPSCLVNYRRIALQDEAAALRVTLDVEIGFYAPPRDLWTRDHALVRGTFGAPARVEEAALVEVKSLQAAPAWLARSLHDAGASEVGYSKFVRASQALRG